MPLSQFDAVWVPRLEGAFLTEYEGVLNRTWAFPITKQFDAGGEFLKVVDLGTVGAIQQGVNVFTSPNAYTLTLQNLVWTLGMAIDAEDARRDLGLGMYAAKAAEIGAKFADHTNKQVINQITTNPNCFDGTAFFGSNHPVNGTTQTNDLSSSQVPALASSGFSGATSTAPTALMMATAILQAAGYFYTLIDEAGDPINGGAREFLIVTSNPNTYAAAAAAINSFQLDQGRTNPLYAGLETKGWKFEVAIDPRLGAGLSDTKWYMHRVDSPVKPYLWSEETGVEMSYLGDGSYPYVKDNQFLWRAKAVRSFGVGRYQHALRLTNS